jgi:APA family basic amino acid/polyamine antiporter
MAGSSILSTLALGGVLALLNGLSVAQLSADLPLSGGTYEFAYRHLHPWAGFSAGWFFLWAKSASAATAALGVASYALELTGATGGRFAGATVPLALLLVVALTTLSALGIRRSNRVNAVVVSVSIFSLLLFMLVGLPGAISQWGTRIPLYGIDWNTFQGGRKFFEATALIFVSYAGYGRIATLGEEMAEPRKTIPRALLLALGVAFVLYAGVVVTAVGQVGPMDYAELASRTGAPLEQIAVRMGHPWLAKILGVGGVAALMGVLINLVLGLSRVAFAMGRRGDLPRVFARVESVHRAPFAATLFSGVLIALMVIPGNIEITWSFSAFTVLVYYALTNAAALRLPKDRLLYPRFLSALGLIGCLSLAFWVDWYIWTVGLVILIAGVFWRVSWRRYAWRKHQEALGREPKS